MTLTSYPVRDAADLAYHSYNPRADSNLKTMIVDECPVPGVEATLLNNGFLLIPGSNSLLDYLQFNLRLFRIGHQSYDLSTDGTVNGASGTLWHQGFFAHAKVIYDWMGDRRPTLIVGHSLGAASAQILSKSWARTAIGFAAPRPRKTRGRVVRDGYSLCVCRVDDPVCGLVSSFHHMGLRKTLVHSNPRAGLNHAMTAYISALENNAGRDAIPKVWNPLAA